MSTSRYTVRRVGWFQPPHGDPYTRRLPGAEPVAAFDTFDDAEMHRRELEAAARSGENPFRFGGASVFFQSSLDGPRLHDWLMDAGIDPPASELRHSDWREWWNAFAHTWNADQLAHAWAAFDKVRFFDVAEEPGAVAHLLVQIEWGRVVPSTLTAATEGGRAVTAFRSAARASAARDARDRAVTTGYDFRGARWFRYSTRIGYGSVDDDVPLSRGTFFEIAAVPSDVPPLAALGYLVQRRAVLAPRTHPAWRLPQADARVPVALFADRAAALAERDRLAAEARQALNPFAFVEPEAGAATDDGRETLAELAPPLPVPGSDRRPEWVEWFDLCQDEMGDDQRAAVWELCDQSLFEVIRVEVADA